MFDLQQINVRIARASMDEVWQLPVACESGVVPQWNIAAKALANLMFLNAEPVFLLFKILHCSIWLDRECCWCRLCKSQLNNYCVVSPIMWKRLKFCVIFIFWRY